MNFMRRFAAKLEPVLRNVAAATSHLHLEVTTLIIRTERFGREIDELARLSPTCRRKFRGTCLVLSYRMTEVETPREQCAAW